jgi:hypothetical protein
VRLAVLACCCALAATAGARAEPAFAVRTGYRCAQCHVNRSGGGMRTAFGSLYTQTILPRRLLPWRGETNLLPADPDARFALGGDARFQYLYVAAREGEDLSSFEVPEANLYGEARLIPGRLSAYLDEEVGSGSASAREVFGLFAIDRGRSYVKAGKFLPAYGWRLPDDAAFIRQFSGFAYSSPDTGVEFGAEPGPWSVHLAVLNGSGGSSDTDRTKRFTLLTTRRFRAGRVGVSGANNLAGGSATTHAGVLGGTSLGRLVVLAEADWVRSGEGAGEVQRLLGFIEGDLLISRGLNVKLARDYIDPDRDVSTDARTRDSLGVEVIPWPFVQLRAFVRHSDGPPQVQGSRDTQLDLELHLFF